MTPVSQGWAFLVARGRRTGYRTVLAPRFLLDANLHHVLAQSTGAITDGMPSNRMIEIDNARVGPLSIGHTSEQLTRADIEAAGLAADELLTDEHGRPLEIIYGVVSRDRFDGPLDAEDLRVARTYALQSYRTFLADEERHTTDAAPAFELRTRTVGPAAASVADEPTKTDRSRSGRRLRPSSPRRARWAPSRRAIALAIIPVAVAAGALKLARRQPGGAPHGPLAVTVLPSPQSVLGTDRRIHIVYELRLENTTPERVRIDAVDVDVGARRTALAKYRDGKLTGLVNMPHAGVAPRTIARGESRLMFLDVRLPTRYVLPASLEHHFVVTTIATSGREHRVGFRAASIPLTKQAVLRVSPPLAAGRLGVTSALGQDENRRAVAHVDDRDYLARRFSINFQQYDAQGRTFAGEPGRNTSYFIYGARVVAAAGGTIVATRDGVRANQPGGRRRATVGDIQGNFVVQRLGNGRFAVYSHLQAGSLRVKPGERVGRRELLGLVGNSGRSTEPGLRFGIANGAGGASTLAADGLAFVFDRFVLESHIGRDGSSPTRLPARQPRLRIGQYPLSGDVISTREPRRSPPVTGEHSAQQVP
jgi:murein DD-endopeptidase MepM/ murein hydrolase activator NlpD